MANFYMTLPAEELARQVAKLLNDHNQLTKTYNFQALLASKGAYFVDVIGGRVVGCQAIWRENDQITRLYHLCVHPDFRRQGLARRLKLAALANVTTPYAYVTIREENTASINLNTGLGFVFVKKDWAGNHHVLTFGRLMNDAQAAADRMADEVRRTVAPRPPKSQSTMFHYPKS